MLWQIIWYLTCLSRRVAIHLRVRYPLTLFMFVYPPHKYSINFLSIFQNKQFFALSINHLPCSCHWFHLFWLFILAPPSTSTISFFFFFLFFYASKGNFQQLPWHSPITFTTSSISPETIMYYSCHGDWLKVPTNKNCSSTSYLPSPFLVSSFPLLYVFPSCSFLRSPIL